MLPSDNAGADHIVTDQQSDNVSLEGGSTALEPKLQSARPHQYQMPAHLCAAQFGSTWLGWHKETLLRDGTVSGSDSRHEGRLTCTQ